MGGLVVSGTVIPDWQWFDEVEHAARAAFVVHTGGSVDDEHGGWASLFDGVAQSLVQARDEHRAAREATNTSPTVTSAFLPKRTAPTTSTSAKPAWSLPVSVRCRLRGCTGAGRLSEVSGWSFGHLGVEPSATPDPSHA